MDDWSILEIPQDTLYVPETVKDKHNFDYIIKTIENNNPLGQDIGEEFHLLSKNSIYEHSQKYKYLHKMCTSSHQAFNWYEHRCYSINVP